MNTYWLSSLQASSCSSTQSFVSGRFFPHLSTAICFICSTNIQRSRSSTLMLWRPQGHLRWDPPSRSFPLFKGTTTGLRKGWAYQDYLHIPTPTATSSSTLDSLWGRWSRICTCFEKSPQVSLGLLLHSTGGTAILRECWKPSNHGEEGSPPTAAGGLKLHSYSSWLAHLGLCWLWDHGRGPYLLSVTHRLGLQDSEEKR